MCSKTSCANVVSVVDYNGQFYLPPFKKYPQQLKLRGGLHHWDKSLPGWSILRMIPQVRILNYLFYLMSA